MNAWGQAQPFLPGLEPAPGTVSLNNRKYLGSKFRLLEFILEAILSRVSGVGTFADPFAGTGAVAQGFRAHAGRIIAGDLLFSNYVALRAFLTSTAETVEVRKVTQLLGELNALEPCEGYVSRSYGGTYFTRANAGRIDAIREAIEALHAGGRCGEQERFVLLASLLLAVDKAANTVGQYDAFLKHIDPQATQGHPLGGDRHLVDSNVHKPLSLCLPAVQLDGNHEVHHQDANALVRTIEADVLYLDPPYNSRQYVDCYHVLENIMLWEKPQLYGKTLKFERSHLKSRYSRRQEAPKALAELIDSARAGHIFLSYNDEGIIADEQIIEILRRRGPVERWEREYPVFGNGAGSSRKRTIRERLYYCRPASRRPAGSARDRSQPLEGVADPAVGAGPRSQADKIELFDSQGRSRGFYSPRNRLNELTGREWVYWSKSVITNPYPPSLQHALRSRHGGQKPPELCADLIRVFTKRGQRVLDPFAGVGGTLLGASLCEREALGIEINSEWIEIYRRVCALEGITEQRLLCGDSRTVLAGLAAGEPGGGEAAEPVFDLLLTDVPYWRMDRAARSKGKYKRVGEPQRERRPSKLQGFHEHSDTDKEQWRELLREVFEKSLRLLRPGAYVAVFIGDMYHGGRCHFLAAEVAGVLEALGLVPKANLIWYDVSKSLHVYGYQYEFIPSMIHQNILVFRRQS